MPHKDRAKHLAYLKDYSDRRRERIRHCVDEAKSTVCADCDVQYPLPAMQFDHVRGEKKFNIAEATSRVSRIETLHDEIAKCDVVCANCHAIRTAARIEPGSRWYRERMEVEPDRRAGTLC